MSYPPHSARSIQSDSNPHLSEARKSRLLALKKREDLKQVLVEKFTLKNPSSSTAAITDAVSSFVNTAKLTEKNLLKLEQHIAGDSVVSEYTARSTITVAPTAEHGSTAQTGPSWSILDTYASHLATLDTQRARQSHMDTQQSLKGSLDQQVAEARARRAKEKRDEVVYSEALGVESAQWLDYERRVAEERRARAEKEQRELKETEELRRDRGEQEKRRQREEEEKMLERIRKEIVQEKTKIERRKTKEREAVKQIMIENEQDRKIKKQQDTIKVQEDVRLMEEYNKMLIEQEGRREAEVKARLERQKKLMEKMQARVEQETQGRLDEDNDRALKQANEREERAAILDRIKHERKEQLRHKMINSLQEQVREKEYKKEQDEQLKAIHAMIMREDTEVYKGEEEIRRRARVEKLKTHKRELERQIEEKKHRKILGKDEMTATEAKINKHLLQVVERVMTEKEISDLGAVADVKADEE